MKVSEILTILHDTWNHFIHGLALHLVLTIVKNYLNVLFQIFLLFLTWENRQNQLSDFNSNKIQKQRTADQKWSPHLWDGKKENVLFKYWEQRSQHGEWHSNCTLGLTKSWHPQPRRTQWAEFPLQRSMGYNLLGKTSRTPEEACECKT